MVPSGIQSVLEAKICSSCCWGSPELYFPLCNLGQGNLCASTALLPALVMLLHYSTLFSEYLPFVA